MLRPFHALRPTRDKAYLVATRSYISYNHEELADKLANNPYTFLHVINPSALVEYDHDTRYEAVRQRFNGFVEDGIFFREEHPHYYLYEQRTETATYVGLIGLLDAQSVAQGRTLPHEKTLAPREALFAHYLEVVGFQAEPVLVFGPTSERYTEIVAQVRATRAEYEFASTDKHVHLLWPIPEEYSADLAAFFEQNERCYIADGHHRLASSAQVAERQPNNAAAQGVLTMYIGEDQVGVESFERWFKLVDQVFTVNMLKERFEVEHLAYPNNDFCTCDFQMYLDGQWFGLRHKEAKLDDVLSTQMLIETILEPLLGVMDVRNDARLTYVRQTGEDKSSEMVRQGYDLGFRLPPVPIHLLKRIAEERGSMPPKSTYIEPKLRSGLLLHAFK